MDTKEFESLPMIEGRPETVSRPTIGASASVLGEISTGLAASSEERGHFLADPAGYLRRQGVEVGTGSLKVVTEPGAESAVAVASVYIITAFHSIVTFTASVAAAVQVIMALAYWLAFGTKISTWYTIVCDGEGSLDGAADPLEYFGSHVV